MTDRIVDMKVHELRKILLDNTYYKEYLKRMDEINLIYKNLLSYDYDYRQYITFDKKKCIQHSYIIMLKDIEANSKHKLFKDVRVRHTLNIAIIVPYEIFTKLEKNVFSDDVLVKDII